MNSYIQTIPKKKEILSDGTIISHSAYSSIDYEEMNQIFKFQKDFFFSIKELPLNSEDIINTYIQTILQSAEVSIECIDSSNEATILFFILNSIIPVLKIHKIFKYEIEKTLEGSTIELSGRFEIIITLQEVNSTTNTTKDIKICIVDAKKNDYPKGRAQCLAGMEILADTQDSTTTYGIVSDFSHWFFLRSNNENVLVQELVPFSPFFEFPYDASKENDEYIKELVKVQLKNLFIGLYSFFSMIKDAHSITA